MLPRLAFLLLLASLSACSGPSAPSNVQTTPQPGLASLVRIESLQVRRVYAFPGPLPEDVAPEPDGTVILGEGTYSVRVTWFNPKVSGRYVQVSATSQPDGALSGFLTKTWPEDAYTTLASASPGIDGWTVVLPDGVPEARVVVELVETGPDLPSPHRVQGSVVIRRR